jgi:hypothetical protein
VLFFLSAIQKQLIQNSKDNKQIVLKMVRLNVLHYVSTFTYRALITIVSIQALYDSIQRIED